MPRLVLSYDINVSAATEEGADASRVDMGPKELAPETQSQGEDHVAK